MTDRSLWLEESGRVREIPYLEMASVHWSPDDKRDANSLQICLRDGSTTFVPVLGRKDRFADVFEFQRFVMRAMGRVPAAMTARTKSRRAEMRDVPTIVAIYNQGITERIATFETRPRVDADIMPSLQSRFPIIVVEDAHGIVVAFASTSLYRSRECYAGIAEFSVYVERAHRRLGIGRIALQSLVEVAEAGGFWKLVSRIFVENAASRELCRALGFREVGIYRRHGKLDGEWRDVVIVERVFGEAAAK